ncbi:MAG: methylated-DNA--[protein]-cysteine S-methyltransferase [Candidatus Azambacteria bacterium]|nr:methylated-DNA--[protein]-cysteine S-methyltransferase [Candidatus Azambacteria bacterium]
MRREQSAGFIVVRETPRGALFLLLQSQKGFWGFPKGGIKKGECFIDTAVRELKEETGIDHFFIVSGFRTQIRYIHEGKKGRAHKTVTLYLAKTDTAKVLLSHEHATFRWLSHEDVIKAITFRRAQQLFERAHQFYMGAREMITVQERIYCETKRIPKGKVGTYMRIAKECGVTTRGVGSALAYNYDSRVPCHRVVASSGKVSGYNRGVVQKVQMLKKEGVSLQAIGKISRVADMHEYCYCI